MRLRQFLLSLAGFALLLAALVAVDSRVRDELDRLIWGGDGITSWDNHAIETTNSVTAALGFQGIDNGPIMVFAIVGGVLFLLMLRA
jgi:uncharacterized membrane protein